MKESQESRLRFPFSTVIALGSKGERVASKIPGVVCVCGHVTTIGWMVGNGETMVGEIYNRKALRLGVVREPFCRAFNRIPLSSYGLPVL